MAARLIGGIRRLSQGQADKSALKRRRFYKEVSVSELTVPISDFDHPLTPIYKQDKDNVYCFEVKLDNRPIRTPEKKKLRLPTYALALGIAHEWDFQIDVIEPYTMPLMSLSCVALEKIPKIRTEFVDELVRFFETDTTCFFDEENRKLRSMQKKHWEPLHKWTQKNFAIVVNKVTDLSDPSHPPESVESIRKLIDQESDWELASLQSMTSYAKSLIIAFALHKKFLTVDQAYQASRVEEEQQIEEWGLIEGGGHDLDRIYVKQGLSSAATFQLLSNME